MSQANEVKTLNVQGQWINFTGTDGVSYKSYIGSIGLYDIKDLNLTGVTVVIQPNGIDWLSIIFSYGSIISLGIDVLSFLPGARR